MLQGGIAGDSCTVGSDTLPCCREAAAAAGTAGRMDWIRTCTERGMMPTASSSAPPLKSDELSRPIV